MSADLDIPKEDCEQIKKWLIDGQEPAEAVLSALKDAKPTLQRKTLVDAITKAIGGDRSVVNDILRIFFNVLFTVRSREDLKERIEEVYHVAVGSEASDADKLKAFSERVMQLVSLRAMVITGKALRVKLSNSNTFCRARTVSEVRPVFAEQTLKPEAAIIVHQLSIVFHTGPEMDEDEFFVTLDAGDLESLRKVIERALTKEKEIAGTLGEGIQLLVESPS
jgi:hypothetical protein